MNINNMTECLRLFEVSEGTQQETIAITQEMKDLDLKNFKEIMQSTEGIFYKRVEQAANTFFGVGKWTKMITYQLALDNDMKQPLLSLTLVRRRDCENETWAESYLIPISEKEYSYLEKKNDIHFVKKLVLGRLHKFLASKKGWQKVCEACQDYNWGDSALGDLEEACQSVDTRISSGAKIVYETLMVNQDELIAPENVPINLVFFGEQNRILYSSNAVLDMQDGSIFCKSEVPEEAVNCLAVFENGDKIPVNKEEMQLESL